MHRIHNTSELRNLEEGDIVKFSRGLYSHYGIYVGNEEIVHLTVNGDNSGCCVGKPSNKGVVKKENFWTVACNSKATNCNNDMRRRPLPKHEIVKRALSRLGSHSYNLIFSNCEHFANWCRYGVEISEQVKKTMVLGSLVCDLMFH